jgi:CRISPR-associated protein Csh2
MLGGKREIVFLYDVSFANPNGDPINENRPRIDDETDLLYVTDVRLKRTIRDYLHDYKDKEIFIYGEKKDGKVVTKKERVKKSYNKDPYKALEQCIDLRLFGATFALKASSKSGEEDKTTGGNVSITGPVQFKFGRSLHRVKEEYVKGTTVMPSGEGKEQGTFTGKYLVPYALIGFYGVANNRVAEIEGINLTEEDLDLMYEAMWNGTKVLFTTSKSQMPRLLLEVRYHDEDMFLGELDKYLKMESDKRGEEIRDPDDYKLEIGSLVDLLADNRDSVAKVRVLQDERLKTVLDGNEIQLADAVKQAGLEVEQFYFSEP